MFRSMVLACLVVSATAAQTTTGITLSFSVTPTSDITATGSGTLGPYGGATVSVVGATVEHLGDSAPGAMTFTLAAGDTLAATGSAVIESNGESGNMTITAGTGIFTQATGSFHFLLVSNGDGSLTLSGSGTVVTVAQAGGAPLVACDGSGQAAVGAVCQVIVCGGGSGSTLQPAAGCSAVNLDLAGDPGGGTLPVLVYDGVGGSLPVLVFEGGGSTLPVLAFEGGGSTSPVLACCGGSTGTLPVSFPARPNATVAPTGTPVEIVTPLQASAASYTAVARCNGAPAVCWLSLPAPSGTIAASSRAAITASINPAGLTPGVYTAQVAITITPAGKAASVVTIPVTLAMTASQPAIALSQTGVHLTAQGGTGTLSQTIQVINSGTGSLTFSATATALSGGNWLAVTPSSGTAPAPVTIQASPAGLAPGTYFGRVDFAPAGISNATQSVEVELAVLAASATPDATVSPTGLVLTAGGAAQAVQVSVPSGHSLTLTTTSAFAKGTGWFTAKVSGSTVTVTPNAAGLAAGVYVGSLDIHVAETASDHFVTVILVVPAAAPCTATRLLPVITNLEGGFQAAAGFPIPVQALVVDDCGVPLTAGAVLAYFPQTNDTSVSLIALGQGRWSGTWMPHMLAGGAASVGLMASGKAFGSTGVLGTVTANTAAPLAFAGGVVNSASFQLGALAPGSFFSIFGAGLASTTTVANAFPYLTTLGGTKAFLGGEPIPLQVTSSGQINALIPYDAAVDTFQQLIVQTNGVDSMPETLLLAPAQPAVFTLDQSGKGAGTIVVIKPDLRQFVNGPANPATAGDVLVIYGTGLGAVTPAVASGAAAPLTAYTYTASTTTVTIGGKQAQVLFSGLAPGFAGLYQVNVVVPAGVTPGAGVPVIVTDGGASSPAVTVAIQ